MKIDFGSYVKSLKNGHEIKLEVTITKTSSGMVKTSIRRLKPIAGKR